MKSEKSTMANPEQDSQTLCPVARAQQVVGDRWTVVILRELFMANYRFDELLAQTEATPQMLTARLKRLEGDGMIERRAYSTRPLRHEYLLTAKGRGFYPVLLALRAWGETWCKTRDEGVAVRFLHRPCGKDPGLGTTCQACGDVLRKEDLESKLSPAYARERERKTTRARNPPTSEE
jgi:DNA-binding HxlR family transcriptional regulator